MARKPKPKNMLRNMEFVGITELELHKPVFSTFRIGRKWADLRVGDELALVRRSVIDDDKTIMTCAMTTVMAVHSGELGRLVDMHASMHHGCSQPEPSDRRLELWRYLEKAYGRTLGVGERCTVAYLLNMDALADAAG